MNLIKKILISLICILTLTGCSNGLGRYKRNGQYNEITYQELDQKIINDDSFVFFLTKNGCPGCKSFYPEVEEFLKENKDKTIYTINESNMEETDKLVLAAYYLDVLGNKYFETYDRNSMVLYTPSICKVLNGKFVFAQIGNMDKSTLEEIYQDNYTSLPSFYSFNKKTINKETFDMFVSKSGDSNYDELLRQYFIDNPTLIGNYLDCGNFDTDDNEKLINRINNYLGEGNGIETLPEYCLLQYENGILVNFVATKYDVESLNSLYNK